MGSTFKWALYSNVKEEFGSFWQQLGILESDLYRLRERERERERERDREEKMNTDLARF